MFGSREARGFPGYFEIPGFSRYAITPDGVVINKTLNREISGSINPAGYRNFRLLTDTDWCLTIGRHRLLGLAFMWPGDDDYLMVVNHINGIKGDDRLSNLEWVTHQGNIEHAGANGLTLKCIPVEVRNVDTGEVTRFTSAIGCARRLGLSKDAIQYRVRVGHTRVFPERRQYRKATKAEPWFIPEDIELAIKENGQSKHVLMRRWFTGEVTEFVRMTDLAEHLNVSPSTITQWLNTPNQPVLPGLCQLKWASDPTPWRKIHDVYLEHEQFTGMRAVKTMNVHSGEGRVYLSATECAEARNLSTTALNYRLNSARKGPFPDGYIYRYYSEPYRLE